MLLSAQELVMEQQVDPNPTTVDTSTSIAPPDKVPQPTSQFRKLSPTLYEYIRPLPQPSREPAVTLSHVSTTEHGTKPTPAIIALFGWAGAPLYAMKRFAKGHSKEFPTARVLIILCTPMTLYFQTDQAAHEGLMPLLRILSAHMPSSSSKDTPNQTRRAYGDIPPVILHAFSNGGLIPIRSLALAWRTTYHTPLPFALLVLDSGPGSGRFRKEAFRWANSAIAPFLTSDSIAAKVPGARALLNIAALGWVTAVVAIPEIATGRENLVSAGRRCVNDLRLLDTRGSLLYIYSSGDEAVRWQDVESNIEVARRTKRDGSVMSMKVERSNHVAHEKIYPERYWQQVRRAWEEATTLTGSLHIKSKL